MLKTLVKTWATVWWNANEAGTWPPPQHHCPSKWLSAGEVLLRISKGKGRMPPHTHSLALKWPPLLKNPTAECYWSLVEAIIDVQIYTVIHSWNCVGCGPIFDLIHTNYDICQYEHLRESIKNHLKQAEWPVFSLFLVIKHPLRSARSLTTLFMMTLNPNRSFIFLGIGLRYDSIQGRVIIKKGLNINTRLLIELKIATRFSRALEGYTGRFIFLSR